MTDPHERPPLPTGTQEHDDPAATQELDGEAMQNELRKPNEVDPPHLVDAAPVETSDVEAAADESGAENVVEPAVSDTDQPATSRKGRRRAQPAKRGKGRVAAIASGTALGIAATAFVASRLLGPGGDTEAPVTSDATEEVAPGVAGGQNQDNPIEVEASEPTEEPQTSDAEASLPEATGKVDGVWQDEYFMEVFGAMEEEDPETFFENNDQIMRFEYAVWKTGQYADEASPNGLELPTIGALSHEELVTISSEELLDAYNTMIHRILPIILDNEGVDGAKRFLYAITADTPQGNPFKGKHYDEARQKWLDTIAAYPDNPVDHGPYLEPTTTHDTGAAWASRIRQVTAKEDDTATLDILFHIDHDMAQAVHIIAGKPYDHDENAAVVPMIIYVHEQILGQ